MWLRRGTSILIGLLLNFMWAPFIEFFGNQALAFLWVRCMVYRAQGTAQSQRSRLYLDECIHATRAYGQLRWIGQLDGGRPDDGEALLRAARGRLAGET
ncbi:hypothetical protein AWM79_06355 [Pseudomonas agarici]|uniref:Uncharacterized protein n=1 Tax=Pseudomonas agarici TaxID=46677 RepID=A0A0X1SYU6_PSEAA|nr:hypothetical protein AWM79_06355 [Pseudomonas agarici]